MIDKINLFNGLNLSPIPLEFSQGMTTTKQLLAMQSGINAVIDIVNAMVTSNNNYTDSQIDIINNLLTNSDQLDAKFLQDKSVTLDKITNDSISSLHERIMSYIGNIMKFVTFEINDEGYFIANVPETWGGISFSTDIDGNLILNVKY